MQTQNLFNFLLIVFGPLHPLFAHHSCYKPRIALGEISSAQRRENECFSHLFFAVFLPTLELDATTILIARDLKLGENVHWNFKIEYRGSHP